MQLERIDWIIIGSYFGVVLLIGLLYTRRAGKSLDEYFLSGRHLPWWIVGTSMVATTFSADTPNLVTDIVRGGGVSGNWVWWAYLLTGMFTVFLYAKLWRRSKVLTDIGFYEIRYSGRAAAFLRGFRAIYLGLFLNVLVMGTVNLAAIKLGNVLLGIDKYTTVLVCGAITVFYSCTAGLWGVVITDVLLFVVAMAGSVAAAYYALSHPDVGGLAGLMSNGSVASHLSIMPDFNDWNTLIPVFIIPFAVQWWGTWYPGAEPGGGGYIAQRMLASKDERNSMTATLWFNVAHYAIRPWPWILVALCSLIVYPDLASIAERFPNVEASMVKNDLAYPAMLVFLPAGMLGLVVASLAAAYMSTISTHLNWGSSYIVDDFYKRFWVRESPEKHYVFIARLTTLLLWGVSAAIALFFIENAKQGFDIIVQLGAGTGLLFFMRWFWWRVNAWSEITAMVVSAVIAVYFTIHHDDHFARLGYEPLEQWARLTIQVLTTTAAWLLITFVTPKTKPEKLQAFYDRIRPMGRGWAKVVDTGTAGPSEEVTPAILGILLGCMFVYGALFSTGYFIYGRYEYAVFLGIVALVSAVGILRLLPRLRWRE